MRSLDIHGTEEMRDRASLSLSSGGLGLRSATSCGTRTVPRACKHQRFRITRVGRRRQGIATTKFRWTTPCQEWLDRVGKRALRSTWKKGSGLTSWPRLDPPRQALLLSPEWLPHLHGDPFRTAGVPHSSFEAPGVRYLCAQQVAGVAVRSLSSKKTLSSKNQSHQRPLASKTTFIKDHFHRKK